MKDHSSKIVKASEVIGVTVKNNLNEDLGKVEDLVLDKNSGQVQYFVLSFGGFLGMGDKYFAFPWKSIHHNGSHFILSVEKEKLKRASGFDKNNWPDMQDPSWQKSILDFFSEEGL